MTDVKGAVELGSTVAYRLGALGSVAESRFAARVEPLGIKPKHAGLLAALAAGGAPSQQDLAARLGVAPSLVVSLADHLEACGAVERTRDSRDRRRQVLTLTREGRGLLARCAAAARELDDELTAAMTDSQVAALREALELVGRGL
ncbi:MarR family transcriptional regulator [Streptomyces sp. NPDC001380]|uniref:MarR family transcriptional regulator n=1 Tax=Streptomyces sp. NPDC001380 TaxID=3364566 RepID=UPI00369D4DBA